MAGQGGSTGGSTAGAAMAGMNAAGAPTMDTIADVAKGLDGYLFTARCADGGTGFDCTNSGCSNNQKDTMTTIQLGGTPGKIYDLTLKIRGVVEAKRYDAACMRRAMGNDASATGGDFWCEGGGVPNSSYNSYELHVLDANGMKPTNVPRMPGGSGNAPHDYYLNSRTDAESHASWALNYSSTIPVVGGGRIRIRIFDSNCRQIMNCGPGTGGSTCMAPRTLNMSDAMPPVMGLSQPNLGHTQNAPGQWIHIDVTGMVARN